MKKKTIRDKLISMDSSYVYANSGYTQFAKLIHLDGEWEVAVTQIYIKITAEVLDILLSLQILSIYL